MELARFNDDIKFDSLSTDEALEMLCKYGRPKLGVYGVRGWCCSIDVFINGKGVSFDVTTDFKQETPNEAVRNCLRLLNKAIKEIKDTK